LLSGDVLVTRFTVSPDLDIAALATQTTGVQSIAPPDAASNHFRLDVHLQSSPQLNFQNAYAKLAGNMDLRLRGTVASPSLLGRVSITEGSALIAGTRYELEHGDVFFTNPIRIQPSVDLNATARVEDYDITLGLHGTLDKPSITYRSDPPLPEADVVALLALGRTESQQRIYTQQQLESGANPATDALLGGALNATVSSRVQKLFGAGSVKVDPNFADHRGGATGPQPDADLRDQREYHRAAAGPGRSGHQPACFVATGPRRIGSVLHGPQGDATVQVAFLTLLAGLAIKVEE
jgi:translocation and assembly module TamB